MGTIRKRHSAIMKAKVALASLRQDKTMAQLSSEFGIHTNQIQQWKKDYKHGARNFFNS